MAQDEGNLNDGVTQFDSRKRCLLSLLDYGWLSYSGPPNFSMYWLGLTTQITSIALLITILVLMASQHLYRQFPGFVTYATYVILQIAVRSVFLSNGPLYFYVYWFTAPVEVILAILAVYESFTRVFRVFYLLRWFRILFPFAIVLALAYTALRGYFSPPTQADAAGTAIIAAMMTGQYVILTISLVFFALAALLRVPWRIHEYRFVLGFGISSVTTAFAGSIRSEFGTRFAFLSGILPALTYILVLVIWLSAAVHPLPVRVEVAGEQPEDVVQSLRRHLSAVRSAATKD